jgi:hypothetical protein
MERYIIIGYLTRWCEHLIEKASCYHCSSDVKINSILMYESKKSRMICQYAYYHCRLKQLHMIIQYLDIIQIIPSIFGYGQQSQAADLIWYSSIECFELSINFTSKCVQLNEYLHTICLSKSVLGILIMCRRRSIQETT